MLLLSESVTNKLVLSVVMQQGEEYRATAPVMFGGGICLFESLRKSIPHFRISATHVPYVRE